jgi:amino acid adenylation domain-containing protein
MMTTTESASIRDEGGAGLALGTGVRTQFERESTIDELFTLQALELRHAPAVVGAERSVTYAELDRDSNRVANYLRSRGIEPGATVGVALERSVDLPTLLLGILKAGAAYVPLDPSYPRDRLLWMIEDAAVSFILADERCARFPLTGAVSADVAEALSATSDRRPAVTHGPTSLAYIMYTSGSTGRPKGVAIEHRGVVRLVRATDYAAIETSDTFLQFAPLAFDASTFEIWAPLLNGARLAVPRPGLHAMDELAHTMDRFGVTTMFLTTALFQRFVDESSARPRSMRHLLTGGEVASPSHMARFLQLFPRCRLSAVYGPTENTTFSTWCDLPSVEAIGTAVPIGKPIANSTAFVLDRELRLVQPGVVGELCVGGDGVGRGYLNLPQLTSERFVPDPFSNDRSARLYRTGDRARLRADGLLEFVGRDDDQVKVRGHRIELGEIECVFRSHRSVGAAAVVVAERDGQKEIVAHVILLSGAAVDERSLRAHLACTLPSYMLPHRIVIRTELPLSSSGKVDRQALAGDTARLARRSNSAPVLVREARPVILERTIAELWRELLGRKPELDENFFDAGGDSLRLLTMHTRLREQLGADVKVTDLFEQSTIRKLAAFLAASQARA